MEAKRLAKELNYYTGNPSEPSMDITSGPANIPLVLDGIDVKQRLQILTITGLAQGLAIVVLLLKLVW